MKQFTLPLFFIIEMNSSDWKNVISLENNHVDHYDINLYFMYRSREVYLKSVLDMKPKDKIETTFKSIERFAKRLDKEIYVNEEERSRYTKAYKADLGAVDVNIPMSKDPKDLFMYAMFIQNHFIYRWKTKRLLHKHLHIAINQSQYVEKLNELTKKKGATKEFKKYIAFISIIPYDIKEDD